MPNKGVPWKQAMWRLSDGKSVISFCRENNICYSSVMNHIQKGINVDDACHIALEHKGDKSGATKYYIDGISLRRWCIKNKQNYHKIWIKMKGN